MNATQSAIPCCQMVVNRNWSGILKESSLTIASMSNQWPVRTQMQTTVIDMVKLNSSAAVKRPQQPSDIRWPSVHGRIMYWHIGSKRNARATVAMTTKRIKIINWIEVKKMKTYLLYRRRKAFAWSRRRKTWREERWMHPMADTMRVSCPESQSQNLFQGNLLRTIKKFKDTSYLYRVTPARQSASCWSFHFGAFFPSHVLPVPCWGSGSCRKRWGGWRLGKLKLLIQTVQPPSF